MILEATIWSLISIISPALVRRFDTQIRARLGDEYEAADRLIPWLHGLVVPFLALILGSVTAGGLGLRIRSPSDGFLDLLALLTGLAAAGIVLRIRPLPRKILIPAQDIVHEEPRWALYRSTGALWTGIPAVGSVIGFGLALIELALAYLPWRSDGPPPTKSITVLMRAGFSCTIFLISGSFWLALGLQGGILLLAERFPDPPSRDPDSEST